jgi:hypothetical protein
MTFYPELYAVSAKYVPVYKVFTENFCAYKTPLYRVLEEVNMSLACAIICAVTADSHKILQSALYSSLSEKKAKNYFNYNKLDFKEKNSLRLPYKLLCAIRNSLLILMQIWCA